MDSKRKELNRLNNAYKNTLNNAKVTLIEGRGKIVGPNEVDVDGKRSVRKHPRSHRFPFPSQKPTNSPSRLFSFSFTCTLSLSITHTHIAPQVHRQEHHHRGGRHPAEAAHSRGGADHHLRRSPGAARGAQVRPLGFGEEEGKWMA